MSTLCAISFKFRSSNEGFEPLAFSTNEQRESCRLVDVLRAIVQRKGLMGKGSSDFDLLVQNVDTGVWYKEDARLVPRGARLVVERVPAAQRGAGLLSRLKESQEARSSCGTHKRKYRKGPDDDHVPSKRLREHKPRPKRGVPVTFQNNPTKNCSPDNSDDKDTKPMSFLRPNTLGLSELVRHGGGISETSSAQRGVRPGAAWLSQALNVTNTVVPEYLKCPLCNSLIEDAVVLSWDPQGRSACEGCVREALYRGDFVCPLTGKDGISPEGLLPNRSLRGAAAQLRETVFAEMRSIQDSGSIGGSTPDSLVVRPGTTDSVPPSGKEPNTVLVDVGDEETKDDLGVLVDPPSNSVHGRLNNSIDSEPSFCWEEKEHDNDELFGKDVFDISSQN